MLTASIAKLLYLPSSHISKCSIFTVSTCSHWSKVSAMWSNYQCKLAPGVFGSEGLGLITFFLLLRVTRLTRFCSSTAEQAFFYCVPHAWKPPCDHGACHRASENDPLLPKQRREKCCIRAVHALLCLMHIQYMQIV